jgi:hypothetical protein
VLAAAPSPWLRCRYALKYRHARLPEMLVCAETLDPPAGRDPSKIACPGVFD